MTRSLSDASLPWPCCSFHAETDTVIVPMSTHLRTISPEGHSFLRKRWQTWRLDLSAQTAHASYGAGQKRGPCGRAHQRNKETKIGALADPSLPVAVSIERVSPHEIQLVEGLLGHSFLDTLPARLIGDKAYDSDRLDRDMAERYGIEMIAPHRGKRRTSTQDSVLCGVTADVGESNDCLPGSIIFVGW